MFSKLFIAVQRITSNIVGVVLAGGWLFNNKAPPWANFYHEIYITLAVLCLLLTFCYNRSIKVQVSMVTTLPLLLFLLLFAQFQIGLIVWLGDLIVAAVYLLGIVLATQIAQNIESTKRRELLHALGLSLVLAGLGTFFLQAFQLTGLHVDWVRGTDHSRPSGNIGQPNHVGTLGILSLAAAYYLYKERLVSLPLLVAVSALLLVSIALTGSRAAVVGLILVAFFRYILSRRKNVGSHDTYFLWLVVGLVCAYGSVMLFRYYFPPSDFLGPGMNPTLIRMDSSGRIQAWGMLLHQVTQRPWLGYGWGNTGLSHLLADEFSYPLGAHMQSAHNIFLDFLLWFGLPVGILVSLALVCVVVKSLKRDNEGDLFASAAIIALMSHSQFEYPLSYGYFLAYFCVFLGLNTPAFTIGELKWRSVLPYVLISAGLYLSMLLLLVRDHRTLEDLFRRWGMNSLMSSQNFEYNKADLFFLKHFEGLVKYSYRVQPSLDTPVSLQEMERVALRFPTINVVLNYALALEREGRHEQAQLWLRRGCSIHSAKQCAELNARWTKELRSQSDSAHMP